VTCRNKYVVTGSVDGKVKVWQQDEPYEMVKEFAASALSVVSVASTGSVVLSSSLDSRIKAWDIATGEQTADIDCGPVETWSIAVNPTNPELIATTGQSGHVNIWNIKEGTKISTLETPNAKFTMSVAWVRKSSIFSFISSEETNIKFSYDVF
jgi:WD repeat-containing protein 61